MGLTASASVDVERQGRQNHGGTVAFLRLQAGPQIVADRLLASQNTSQRPYYLRIKGDARAPIEFLQRCIAAGCNAVRAIIAHALEYFGDSHDERKSTLEQRDCATNFLLCQAQCGETAFGGWSVCRACGGWPSARKH